MATPAVTTMDSQPSAAHNGESLDQQAGDELKDLSNTEGNRAASPRLDSTSTPPTSPPSHSNDRAVSRLSKEVEALPFLQRPLRDRNGPWLGEGRKMTEWLTLFFDLAVAAVLNTFFTQHELVAPSKILSFLAVYVIIYVMWWIQLNYDVRYEGNDKYHRIFKMLYIAIYLYIGASTFGWDLASIRKWQSIPNVTPELRLKHDLAASSFLTVGLASILHRALMIVQHVNVIFLARKAGRSPRPAIYTICSLVLGMACYIVAIAIPATTDSRCQAKIAMLYLGIAFEVVLSFVRSYIGVQDYAAPSDVAERFGSLTLISLGEGIINIAKAFQKGLGGLGSTDLTLYAHVFLVIGIIYYLWAFLFGHFSKYDNVDRSWVWEFLHFPLLFCIFLFLAALVNTVIISAWGDELSAAVSYFFQAIISYGVGQPLSPARTAKIDKYLSRLAMSPDFMTEYNLITRLMDQEKNATRPDMPGTQNSTVELFQYLNQIIILGSQASGVQVSVKVFDDFYAQQSMSSINPVNETEYSMLQEWTFGDLVDLTNAAYMGCRWVYPAAGVVLILCAFRSLARYRFKGNAKYVIHGMQIFFGLALALLGLLNIGPPNEMTIEELTDASDFEVEAGSNTNPMYDTVDAAATIAIVFAVYTVVTFGSSLFLWIVGRKRRKGRVATDTAARPVALGGAGKVEDNSSASQV